MRNIRESILENRFVQFVQDFMRAQYPDGDYEEWAVEALASVGIRLERNLEEKRQLNRDTS